MPFLMINPGTHASLNATLANAEVIAAEICKDLEWGGKPAHVPEKDGDGWFRFDFVSGDRCVEVDIPGDDPETVCEGKPFVSRRLYVNESSWLYGYALGFIARGLGLEE